MSVSSLKMYFLIMWLWSVYFYSECREDVFILISQSKEMERRVRL